MPQGAAISREEKKVENKEVRILVVDDEPTMADSLRQNFVEEGYSVDTAATGAAAIELFDQGGHHLAICDLQLPDVDGMEVLRHMKDARPTTEVIVVTGYGSVQKAVEATKAGAFYFVEGRTSLRNLAGASNDLKSRRGDDVRPCRRTNPFMRIGVDVIGGGRFGNSGSWSVPRVAFLARLASPLFASPRPP